MNANCVLVAILARGLVFLLLGAQLVSGAPARSAMADEAGAQAHGGMTGDDKARIAARAKELSRLHALIVSLDGEVQVARAFDGPGLDAPVNIKSASKSVFRPWRASPLTGA